MGRISQTFERLRRAHERALIPYVTAGDPDLEMTKTLVREMVRRGGDLIEIGVPFSDPLADGPIVQRASQRALRGGTTLRTILQAASELRRDVDVPIVVGFGVSTPEHVRLVAELADGVVVASAILKLIEDLRDREDRLEHIGDFVAVLKAATPLPPAEIRLPAS